MNISMFLQMAAEACPDRIALTFAHERYSYAELYQAAQAAAEKIKASGAAYASVIDVSNPSVPIMLMGAALAGVPYVPLNFRLTEEEIRALMARISPVYLCADETNLHRFAQDSAVTLISRDDFLSQCTAQNAGADAIEPPMDPEQVAVQLFTSGTTGAPKAAILRHEHLVSYILSTIEFMGAEETEATLVSVPPYHIAGISAVMSSIYACRRIVQLPDFGAAAWLDLAEREQISNAFVVPTMLSRIIEHLDTIERTPNTPALNAIAYGGGKMPLPVIERAMTLFKDVSFTNAYGLTETSSTVALLDPEDHREAFASEDPAIRRRLASVGKPLPTIELEIRDDEGKVLGADEAGEIYVRGEQVSGEYLERKATDDDGWFPTRDAGFLDAGGYLFLSGRADDVIVRGGENISPSEIEDVLLGHQAVSDVAVVAIPSEEWGEAVAAAVVLKNDAEVSTSELQHLVKQSLRSSRVPETIQFVAELPYNETGKLLRRVIKTWF